MAIASERSAAEDPGRFVAARASSVGNESAAPSTSHNALIFGRFPVGSPRDAYAPGVAAYSTATPAMTQPKPITISAAPTCTRPFEKEYSLLCAAMEPRRGITTSNDTAVVPLRY